MGRRFFENAFAVLAAVVLVGVLGGGVALVVFWRPSLPTSALERGLAEAETPAARAERCQRPPSPVVALPRALRGALAEGEALSAGLRAEAIVEGDPPRMHGYRLMEISRGSVFERVGLCEKDEITAVAGLELTGPDVVFDVYDQAKDLDEIRLNLRRAGRGYIVLVHFEP